MHVCKSVQCVHSIHVCQSVHKPLARYQRCPPRKTQLQARTGKSYWSLEYASRARVLSSRAARASLASWSALIKSETKAFRRCSSLSRGLTYPGFLMGPNALMRSSYGGCLLGGGADGFIGNAAGVPVHPPTAFLAPLSYCATKCQ